MDFSDKKVLITGGTRGIGLACAQAFAQAGAKLALAYRADHDAAKTALTSLSGEGHITLGGNIADTNFAKNLIEETVQTLDGLDILVNNAGIFQAQPIDTVSFDEWQASWQRTLAVNLLAPANLSYHAAQHMIERGGGRIVNVSSRGAFRGEPESPAYGASKAGLNAMSQSLAQKLAPRGIFVGVVAPGYVETDMTNEHLKSERGGAIRAQSPLNRVARPEEVAHAVLFLASEGAEFSTGAILDVNGASYLRS